MKTISDFKKRMVKGAKLDSQRYLWREYPVGSGEFHWMLFNEFKDRVCTHSQSNSFACSVKKEDGSIVSSWCDWPKRGEVEFPDSDTAVIRKEGIMLVYQFCESVEA